MGTVQRLGPQKPSVRARTVDRYYGVKCCVDLIARRVSRFCFSKVPGSIATNNNVSTAAHEYVFEMFEMTFLFGDVFGCSRYIHISTMEAEGYGW